MIYVLTILSLLTGFVAGIFFMNHLAVLAEQDRLADLETGTPLASQLAREMGIEIALT
jgi:hypothetical protein